MKLSEEEANQYFLKAGYESMQSSQRFGQALFNALPAVVTDHIRGDPEKDFFYDTSPLEVLEKFSANCVEK